MIWVFYFFSINNLLTIIFYYRFVTILLKLYFSFSFSEHIYRLISRQSKICFWQHYKLTVIARKLTAAQTFYIKKLKFFYEIVINLLQHDRNLESYNRFNNCYHASSDRYVVSILFQFRHTTAPHPFCILYQLYCVNVCIVLFLSCF